MSHCCGSRPRTQEPAHEESKAEAGGGPLRISALIYKLCLVAGIGAHMFSTADKVCLDASEAPQLDAAAAPCAFIARLYVVRHTAARCNLMTDYVMLRVCDDTL